MNRLCASVFVVVVGIVGLIAACAPPRAEAKLPDGLTYTITPIVGYEWARKSQPTPHVKGRLIYGARVVAGYRVFSGELEATQAQDEEQFLNLRTEDKDQTVKLGVRSEAELLSFLSGFVRLGGQASRNEHTETPTGGSATTTKGKIQYDPYAGLGVSLALADKLSANLGVTVVFKDSTDIKKCDVQTSAGVGVHF